MSNARKLRLLKQWTREFKRQFGVKNRIVCRLGNQSAVRDPSCASGRKETFGLSWMNKAVTVGYIELDPHRAWHEDKDGPYNTALHEFIHIWLRLQAKADEDGAAEEVAVRKLTKIYLEKFTAVV